MIMLGRRLYMYKAFCLRGNDLKIVKPAEASAVLAFSTHGQTEGLGTRLVYCRFPFASNRPVPDPGPGLKSDLLDHFLNLAP